jgi:uncharacterized protein
MSTAREIVLASARGGADAVQASRARLNDLNVYPVPDGDTGTNLARTAARLVSGLESDAARDPVALAAAARRAALAGASGNSGIILSQIVGGFAEVLGAASDLDPAVLARALRTATEAAYRPVQHPIEGTMLTVIREMAEAAETLVDSDLDTAIDRVLETAAGSVERTQEMLTVLREAGVVDAGAAGLVEFARGAAAGYRGQLVGAPSELLARPLSIDAVHQEPTRYRYCTAFLVEGERVDAVALERELEPLGDCLLVVGATPLYKVHVHTDDPGRALSVAVAMGSVDAVEIANMQEQVLARERRLVVVEGGADMPLTAANTAIVLDSTADFPDPQQVHPNWRCVPLTVRFGDQEFADGVQMTAQQFYNRLRDSPVHPTTAAPAPGRYAAAFSGLARYQRIYALPVSAGVSASHSSALVAAQDDQRVRVLDGMTVSVGTVLLADGLQRMLDVGAREEDIESWFAAARSRLEVLIAVDTLEYLRRGGRIGRTRRFAGGIMGLRPLLTLRDGKVVECGKARGRDGVWKAFDRFLDHLPESGVRVGIAHADAPAAAKQLAEAVKRRRPEASIDRVSAIGAVVGAHGGPGTVALLALPEG